MVVVQTGRAEHGRIEPPATDRRGRVIPPTPPIAGVGATARRLDSLSETVTTSATDMSDQIVHVLTSFNLFVMPRPRGLRRWVDLPSARPLLRPGSQLQPVRRNMIATPVPLSFKPPPLNSDLHFNPTDRRPRRTDTVHLRRAPNRLVTDRVPQRSATYTHPITSARTCRVATPLRVTSDGH